VIFVIGIKAFEHTLQRGLGDGRRWLLKLGSEFFVFQTIALGGYHPSAWWSSPGPWRWRYRLHTLRSSERPEFSFFSFVHGPGLA
jgi:hypothetical protein